ncbi:hypothetical protein KSP39_PZI020817 [Platanthera zijinensis]|uniref:Copper ion binding protein n=1 Tax=Platanthera zijinensis TaxID=2320716 RepID=A0AAP0FWX2_9ASPA
MFRNPKALITSLETVLQPQSHLCIQRFPVSGTAKGKGKDKTAPALKRSVIPKKKPSGGGGGGGGRNVATELAKSLEEACLNAPTPLRYLSQKDRWREAEREKLGLISKERQRELDSANGKTAGPPADEPFPMGTPGFDYISLGLVDADKIPKYDLTVEDGRRLAKEYSRVLMRKHRARQAAESTLLRLKKEAIEALPEKLKAAALVPDFTPFPANRFMATLTPPIEGYLDKVKEAAKRSVMKAKLR